MPFTPVSDLPPNPPVRVFFSGLMLIKPAADKRTCEVFVHRSAPDHQLTIEIRQKHAGRPDVVKMRHVGPLPYALPTLPPHPGDPFIHGLIIQVATAPKGVRSYTGAPTAEGAESLAQAINFQGPSLHNGGVGSVDALGGRPSILLNDAVFYTADKTSSDTILELKRIGGGPAVPLPPIASLIGANIYLDTGDKVMVRWSAQGLLEQIDLTNPAAGSGISYEIYIINDPLYESDSITVPKHDEFREYYKILQAPLPPGAPAGQLPEQFRLEDQFRLKITPPGGQPVRGSTRTPCMSCIIDP